MHSGDRAERGRSPHHNAKGVGQAHCGALNREGGDLTAVFTEKT